MEVWKDLPTMPDKYEVSNMGHIRKKDSKVLLKTDRYDKITGYCRVGLNAGVKRQKHVNVHREVALAFCERSDETKTLVHHINGNKSYNRAENLMFVSPKEHGRLDAALRKKNGIETKARENRRLRKLHGW